MTTLYIEWTGRVLASDQEQEAGLAAAQAVLDAGGSFTEAETACAAAMFADWQSQPDNWGIMTREIQSAAPLMDDELREAIHDDERARDPIWFLAEYRARHEVKFGEPFAF